MNLQTVLHRLDEPASHSAAVAAFWETSLATCAAKELFFLLPDFIDENAAYGGLAPDKLPFLRRTAAEVAGDEFLSVLAWHAYRRLVFHPESDGFTDWPSLAARLGGQSAAFFLLIALAAVPRIRRKHAELGVEETVTRDTCQVIAGQSLNFKPTFAGQCGMPRQVLEWLRHHITGRLFRLGRMEWLMRPFQGGVHVYRHRNDGRVAALAEGGMRITPQGFAHWREEPEPEGCWTTAVAFTPTAVTGHPVDPASGTVLSHTITLDLDGWEHRMSGGMPCLDLHIPNGGGMTPAACRDSFLAAPPFFRRVFPQHAFHGFACVSWILNPALADILPAESNLARFLRQLYLFPFASKPTDGFFYVFGEDKMPPPSLRGETTLQRAILKHIRAGNRWRAGGMFYLFDDLPRFGEEPYATAHLI